MPAFPTPDTTTPARRGGRRPVAGVVLILTGILASALTACAATGPTDNAMPALTLGAPSDGNVSAQVAIADERGYFSDAGVDVDLRYFPSAGDLVGAVSSGDIVIGAGGTVPVTTLRASGFDAVVLSKLADISGAQQVVAAPGITSVEDLRGKRFGALFGTTSEMLALAFLEAHSMSADDVIMVNLGSSDMVTALAQGEVSAAALWEPNVSIAIEQGAHALASGTTDFLSDPPAEDRILGTYAVLFGANGWASENPDAVEAVLTALSRATEYMATDTESAKAAVATSLGMDASIVDATFEANDYSMAIDDQLVRDMKTEADFLAGRGLIEEAPDPPEWIDPSYLSAVDSNLVTWSY